MSAAGEHISPVRALAHVVLQATDALGCAGVRLEREKSTEYPPSRSPLRFEPARSA
jgi:hypothetical protein